ncbi:MAG: hypothetical protein ACRELE_09815 [Gemmatimonadales bacterium]
MIVLGDVAIMGGGCYGTFYVGQLEAARSKAALQYRRLLVVDQNPACQAASQLPDGATLVTAPWNDFLDDWLDASARDRDGLADAIVPTPFMPHLLAQWLERRARARWPDREVALVPADAPLGTPYDRLHADGVRYVSFADWLCPMHCVEPLLCPVIKAPRTWEMGDAVTAWTTDRARERPTAGPALFTCRHVAYGVGMYPAGAAFEGLEAFGPVADAPAGGDLVIGSVSACHGAIAVLRVGPSPQFAAA